MRAVCAIAGLTLRAAVRSRALPAVALLLVALAVALPMTLRGDGTPAGEVQILLQYTLNAANFLLALCACWFGCAAVSAELEDQRLFLVLTKPVSAAQLWLGKWLGLLLLLALLQAVTGATAYGLLRWRTRPGALSPAATQILHTEILTARRLIRPEPPDFAAAARAEYERRAAAGDLPPDLGPAAIIRLLEDQYRAGAGAVPPGLQRRWIFPVGTDTPAALSLRFRAASSAPEAEEPLFLVWVAGAPERSDRWIERLEAQPNAVYTLALPDDAVAADGALTVDVANLSPGGATAVFPAEDGVLLLVPAGGFALNYLRALSIQFARLALLAAVGLTAGCIFTLPVAALLTGWTALLLSLGGYVGTMARSSHTITDTPLFEPFFRALFLGLDYLLTPLRLPPVLEWVSTGEWVGWGLVARTWIWRCGIYAGLLWLLAVVVLRRRELGAPV
ncbi:MAG: ABC transporter permease subunit [Candidatus Marinimicrobia bacterium]|nr:ABC transporter permease subunit [Candidatus Neomarinimicrobiota bacterium]